MTTLAPGNGITFGPYLLEPANARLLRDGRSIALTPRAIDVLHYLTLRPDRLVTKEELLSNVWQDVMVSDASIKVCIGEIRKALDDSAKSPTYIQTVHRRGYRFIAAIGESTPAPIALTPAPANFIPPEAAVLCESFHPFVGRDSELRQLSELFEGVASGRRQCLLVSGGPGSGKTSLIESFAKTLADDHNAKCPSILYGHCFQQVGAGEPFMPVWEAIGKIAQDGGSSKIAALLERHSAAQAAPEGPATPIGPKSDRMLRDISEAIESQAADTPLVLVFEDIQWADCSTIDLISALAGRSGPAKLMLIATYRPADLATTPDHPLRPVIARLLTTGRCREVILEHLSESEVGRYLSQRFSGGQFPLELSRRLHQRTEGCPLFLKHVVDDLVDHGVLSEQDGTWHLAGADEGTSDACGIPAWQAVLDTQIPQSLRAMCQSHIERLDADARNILEAAAVAGVEFSAAAVAAAAGTDVVHAERACEALSRNQRFLERCGHDEWPDGVIATHYRFVHKLFHNVVYEQVPIARRVQLHQIVGARVEAAWGVRATEESANLAMHFETGRDWPRATQYLCSAAHLANRQYAHREAVHYLRRALTAVERLAPLDRDHLELDVLNALSVNLQVTRGFASPEVEEIQARAHVLCTPRLGEPVADAARTFPAMWGIWVFHKVRSNLRKASEMAGQLLTMAQDNPAYQLQAHQAMCVTNLCLGEPLMACHHMEQAAAIYDPRRHSANTELFGQDPGVATMAFGAVALWLLGRPLDAVQASEHSVALARRLRQPSSLALAMHFAAMLHQLRGDIDQTARWSQETITLSEQEGFSFWRAGALVLHGWAHAARGFATESSEAGIGQICRGIDAWLATGSRTYHAYYLGLLADALQRTGRAAEAQHSIDEALMVSKTLGEGLYEAELHRLKGRGIQLLSPHESCPAGAQTCFVKATTTARLQSASAFEERASADLARLMGRRAQRPSLNLNLGPNTRGASFSAGAIA